MRDERSGGNHTGAFANKELNKANIILCHVALYPLAAGSMTALYFVGPLPD